MAKDWQIRLLFEIDSFAQVDFLADFPFVMSILLNKENVVTLNMLGILRFYSFHIYIFYISFLT